MNEIVNKQKGDNNTQIGEQTNIENKITVVNNGLSPPEASKLAMDLFYENFPKLQQIARDTANQRAEELSNHIIEELSNRGATNMNAFASPDVQYVLFEAQKNYARFGDKEKLSLLSKLVSNRVEVDAHSNLSLKVSLDKSITIAGMLSSKQLDYLTLLFLTTRVKFGNIHTIDDLRNHFIVLETSFPNTDSVNWGILETLGCLTISLTNICRIFAKRYGFEEKQVEAICPDSIKNLSGDYSTSSVGTIISIINAEQKTSFRFNIETWVHD